MEILKNHTNEESAYLVEDYPYGYTLRCKIRYWVESKKNKGDRFVSQTLNPKTDRWNKPKKSTYNSISVLYLDDRGYVHSFGIQKGWTKNEAIDKFLAQCGADYPFNDLQLKEIRLCKAINNAQEHFTVSMVNTTGWSEEKLAEHKAQQDKVKDTMKKALICEYEDLGNNS